MNVIIGIIVSIFSSILFAISTVLQKKGVSDIPEVKMSDLDSILNIVRSKNWRNGFIIGQVAFVLYLFALAIMGVAIAHPFILALQLAFLPIFASSLIKEKLGKVETAGILILITAVTFLYLSDVSRTNVDPASSVFLNRLLIFSLIWSAAFAVIVLVFLLTRGTSMRGSAAAVLSGSVLGMSAVLSQAGIEMIAGDGTNFVLTGLFFFFCVLIGNVLGTVLQQIAYQKGKAGVSNSLNNGVSMTVSVMGGIFIFSQNIHSVTLFVTGIVMIMVGCGLLIRFQEKFNS